MQATVPTGNYDSHGNLHQHTPSASQYDSISSAWFFKGGITDHLSFDITPSFGYSWTPQSGKDAPAFEYTPNGNIGIIAGVQVTAAGHNTSRTLSPQMAVMYVW